MKVFKYQLYSGLLHILLIFLLFIEITYKNNNLDLDFNTAKTNNFNKVANIVDIDLASNSQSIKLEKDRYYWGLGISVINMGLTFDRISEVNLGYCGSNAGLLIGDLIVREESDEPRGFSPKTIKLTILRSTGRMVFNIHRCKVYYYD